MRSAGPRQQANLSYETSPFPTSRERSTGRAVLSLNKNCLLGMNGTNGLLLSEAVCSCSRAAASNRTMKISASIATTLLSQSNTRRSKLHFFSAPRCDRQHKLILAVQTEVHDSALDAVLGRKGPLGYGLGDFFGERYAARLERRRDHRSSSNVLSFEAAVVSRSTISSTVCFARPASKSFMVP